MRFAEGGGGAVLAAAGQMAQVVQQQAGRCGCHALQEIRWWSWQGGMHEVGLAEVGNGDLRLEGAPRLDVCK